MKIFFSRPPVLPSLASYSFYPSSFPSDSSVDSIHSPRSTPLPPVSITSPPTLTVNGKISFILMCAKRRVFICLFISHFIYLLFLSLQMAVFSLPFLLSIFLPPSRSPVKVVALRFPLAHYKVRTPPFHFRLLPSVSPFVLVLRLLRPLTSLPPPWSVTFLPMSPLRCLLQSPVVFLRFLLFLIVLRLFSAMTILSL